MNSSIRTCVLRKVAGLEQYIPVEDAVLVSGEKIYFGSFYEEMEKDGPSGSHERRICLPEGKLQSLSLSNCYLGSTAPGKNWHSMSGALKYQDGERIFINHMQFLALSEWL